MELTTITSAVVGDRGVGKTSMLLATSTNVCSPTPILFDDFSVNLIVEGRPIHLVLWDTSNTAVYPEADIFVICFSLGSPSSLQSVQTKWIPELKKCFSSTEFILVGLKSDLRDSLIEGASQFNVQGINAVTTSDGEQMKETVGAATYVKCSRYCTYNLEKVLEEIATVALHSRERHFRADSSDLSGQL
jgi:GTPase SAR1 family protein